MFFLTVFRTGDLPKPKKYRKQKCAYLSIEDNYMNSEQNTYDFLGIKLSLQDEYCGGRL